MKKLDNYKILFILRILKSILTTFVDSFLVLYFLTLSASNILPLGIYKMFSTTITFATIFILRNFCKSRHRINLLRIGIFLDLVYFTTIIILKNNIINYIYLVGVLYGLEEGFYFSVYNMFESDGVDNKDRAKFFGHYTAIKSILAIIFPIIFGSLISSQGFLKSIMIVLLIVIIRIILSFLFVDKNIPKFSKVNIKKFVKAIKKEKNIKQVYKINLFNGLTYSEGAFQSIISVYIMKIFSDSFSLGIFTSIFSLISCLLGILFAKYIKKKNYSKIIQVSMFFTIVSLCIMILKCNMYTIVLFNFCQTISRDLTELINTNSQANLSNLELIRNEYKVEYYLGVEFSLFIGRIISQSLFIFMAFINDIYIIPIFIVFLIMLMFNSIKLQNNIEKNKIF